MSKEATGQIHTSKDKGKDLDGTKWLNMAQEAKSSLFHQWPREFKLIMKCHEQQPSKFQSDVIHISQSACQHV